MDLRGEMEKGSAVEVASIGRTDARLMASYEVVTRFSL